MSRHKRTNLEDEKMLGVHWKEMINLLTTDFFYLFKPILLPIEFMLHVFILVQALWKGNIVSTFSSAITIIFIQQQTFKKRDNPGEQKMGFLC